MGVGGLAETLGTVVSQAERQHSAAGSATSLLAPQNQETVQSCPHSGCISLLPTLSLSQTKHKCV